jgi:beta-aspartyl-peptidase (threonine type)
VHGVVVASNNGAVGIIDAVNVLRQNGSAVDAVVAGIRRVESNPDDHSVGYSGLPNLLGEVELDASVMDGRGLRAGSVGAVRGYEAAVLIAKRVMDDLPHTLIVGLGAERFANEIGLEPTELLTPEARELWRRRLDGADDQGSVSRYRYVERIRELVRSMTSDPEKVEDYHGTVNFIARDRGGNVACGVSTSGWAWKYPGRLGDSPIIGAGNYADDRYGAAACTGRGEMAQRCCTAHSVVTFMRFGMSLVEAIRTAMIDLRSLDDPYMSDMNIVAIDRDGHHGAASTSPDQTYIHMTESMESWSVGQRMHVPLTEG